MKSLKAMHFMMKNEPLTTKAKHFITQNPGTTVEVLHNHLIQTYDIKKTTTNLLLFGLTATNFIKAIGVAENGRKKWAVTTQVKQMSLDEAVAETLLAVCRRQQWLSRLTELVHSSLPSVSHRDVIKEVQALVSSGDLIPLTTKFQPLKLYPDILLVRKGLNAADAIHTRPDEPSTLLLHRDATPKENDVLQYLKACKLKGMADVDVTNISEGMGMPETTVKYYLKILLEHDSIVVSRPSKSGRGHRTLVVLK